MSRPNFSHDELAGLLDRARRLGLRIAESAASEPPDPFDAIAFGAATRDGFRPSHAFSVGEAPGQWLALQAPGPNNASAYIGVPLGGAEGHTRAFALRLVQDLCASADEQAMLSLWQRNIDTFTRELDQAYENLSLLYRLGRRSTQFEAPDTYFASAAEELRQLLGYGWATVVIDSTAEELGEVAGVRRWLPDGADGSGLMPTLCAFLDASVDREHSGIVNCDDRALGHELIVQPLRSGGVSVGWLALGHKAPGADGDPGATSVDTQAAEAVAGCINNVLESLRLYHEQELTFVGTLRALSHTLDAKDRYTRGHSDRVAWLGRALTLAAGHDETLASQVHLSGIVHDIGKIAIPDAVLRKPGSLTDEEYDLIKAHPGVGHEILKDIPAVKHALPGVLHHHERYDGRGYPDGLAGEDIPLMARIMALADAFDAMSSNRAYRPARGRAEVLAEIARCSGVQFDPELADVFVALDFTGFDELIERHRAEQIDAQDVTIDEAA